MSDSSTIVIRVVYPPKSDAADQPRLAAMGEVSPAELLALHGYESMTADGELRLSATHRTPNGVVTRFIQYLEDIPVIGGAVVVRTTSTGAPRSLTGRLAIWKQKSAPEYVISARRAAAIAADHIRPSSLRGKIETRKVVLPCDCRPIFCWKVDIPALEPLGDWEVIVDGISGRIIQIEDRLMNLVGTGLVFDPDPITATTDTTLRDEDDAADAIPEEAYSEVDLIDISRDDDRYVLTGSWVDTSPTENRARLEEPDFSFDREDDRFEEVMAYYHIDRQARYVRSLGFDDLPPSPQQVDINRIEDDISFFSPRTGIITTGTGGVDDAEDGDVLLHEYGHALLHRIVPDWRGGDTGLLSEGLCDYLAGDWSLEVAPDFQPYRLFNWDGQNRIWEGRVLNSDLCYDEAVELDPHDGGQLWSSLLTEIRQASGRRNLWNRVVFDHVYSLTDSVTVQDAASALLESDMHTADGVFRPLIIRACERRDVLPDGVTRPRISHRPLGDTEEINRARLVRVYISSEIPLDPDLLWVIYSFDDGERDTVELVRMNNRDDAYHTYLPAPRREADVGYFIFAADRDGIFYTHPAQAPIELHSYHAGPDRVPPHIVEVDSLPDTVFPDGELLVGARVTDNIGVEEVALHWYWDRMERGGSTRLEPAEWDSSLFTGRFRWSAEGADCIHYRIVAVDVSHAGNMDSSSIQSFAILSNVLIDDFERVTRRFRLSGWLRSDQGSHQGGWCLGDRSENDNYLRPREAVAEVDDAWDLSMFNQARLMFWETHSFDSDHGEYGVVELSEGGREDCQELVMLSGIQDWHQMRTIDLTPYCHGRAAPVRIRFRSFTPSDAEFLAGWKIDEIRLQVGGIVSEGEEFIPASLSLTVPYPNPANDRLMFGYSLREPGRLELFDVTGRVRVALPLLAGSGYSSLNLRGLPAGMYLLRLSSGGEDDVERIVVLK